MEIEEAIYGKLTADPNVAALVRFVDGQGVTQHRVYPNQAPQADTFPLVVYSSASRVQWKTLTGVLNSNSATMHLDCYALSYTEVKALGRVVRDCLSGYAGEAGGGQVQVLGIFDDSADDDHSGPAHADEFGIHRLGLDLSLHYSDLSA